MRNSPSPPFLSDIGINFFVWSAIIDPDDIFGILTHLTKSRIQPLNGTGPQQEVLTVSSVIFLITLLGTIFSFTCVSGNPRQAVRIPMPTIVTV